MGACCCCCNINNHNNNNSDVHTPFTHNNNDGINRMGSFGISSESTSSLLEPPFINNDEEFVFIPMIRVKKTRNGVIGIGISNLIQITNQTKNFYNDWNRWIFQVCYKFVTNKGDEKEWRSIQFTPDTITQKGMFYIKIKLHLYDYKVFIKVRAKHSSHNDWFPYSKLLKVNILSSLIENTFDLGEYINFLDSNSMYTKEGFVDKILKDSFIQIKCKNNNRKLVKIHKSKVYAAPIYLGFVIDLTDRISVDKNILIRNKISDSDNNQIIDIFCTLNDIFKQYAISIINNNNNNDTLRDCDALFMGRFVSKNVLDFIFIPFYHEPRIGCLVDENDGFITTKNYIHHCLNRHQLGIKHKTCDVMTANLQELWSYCDICSIEVSRFDWIASCNISVSNSHVICLNCVNNKIQQKEQLYQLLNKLLIFTLNNDCISQLVEYVVGRVIAHEPI